MLGAWLDQLDQLGRALAVWLPGGIARFAAPHWLPLGLLAVAALLVVAARRRPAALAWPALGEARAAGASRADPVRVAGLVLRSGALLCLVGVIALPLGADRELRTRHDGLDLVLVVDASGSMRALDAQLEGAWRTRLDLAREVVKRFALHRVGEGDRVGLVVFGEHAFTQCPLTSDGRLLGAALERVDAGIAGEATALGDALALATKRVSAAAEASELQVGGPAAGRLVVLLTDGRSNAGVVPTDVAAALAAQMHTRVHTVGIGSRGDVAMAHPSREGSVRFERHDLDERTLRRIAATTGGLYFHARSSADLAAVYDEIDAIERVPRPAPPRVAGQPRPEPLLAGASLLVLAEVLLARVLLRRLP